MNQAMSQTVMNGGCLCGAVQLSVTPANDEADVCHCTMCQRWSGGVAIYRSCTAISVTKDEGLGLYDSSDWGERGFCRECGSSLFWRTKDGKHMSVLAPVLGSQDKPRLTTEIFFDRKPDYYAFANKTKQLSEAETIALFTDADGADAQDENNG